MLFSFIGANHQELAETMIEVGDAAFVVTNIHQFENLNRGRIANLLLRLGEGKYLIEYADQFPDALPEQTAETEKQAKQSA